MAKGDRSQRFSRSEASVWTIRLCSHLKHYADMLYRFLREAGTGEPAASKRGPPGSGGGGWIPFVRRGWPPTSLTNLSLANSVSDCEEENCWVRVPFGGIQFGTGYEHYCGSDSRCILNRCVLLLLDLDAAKEELADLGFPQFDG
jgi:hypothetical protein